MKTNPVNFFKSWLLMAVPLCVLLAACGSKEEEVTSTPEVFPVTNPLVMDTIYFKEYVADIQSIQYVEIRAKVDGYLEKIHADEGQYVRQGQLLFTINNKAYQEELLQAQAMLKSAIAESKVSEVEWQSNKTLVDKNIVAKSQLEMTAAKLEAAKAKIEETKSAVAAAKLRLSLTQIKAPFSGLLNREPNKAGSLIEEGTLLTTLSNNKEVYAYFNVSEKEYLEFVKQKNWKQKNKVSLQLADGQLHPHRGTIETIESEIDKNTGSLAFRARFPNPEQLLKHGASGKVLLENELKDALVIPQKSTFEAQDKLYVYAIDNNNKVQLRNITTKLRLPHLYVVESGLSPNDKIIYEGIQTAKEGTVITPDFKPLRQIISQLAFNQK
jgi:membrane fusion protein (multidrug efflux system)